MNEYKKILERLRDMLNENGVEAALNSGLGAGSYYFKLSEDENESVRAGELTYRYTVPVVPEFSVGNFVETLNRALDMALFDLKKTLPPLFSLINKEISNEEFVKGILAQASP